MRIERSRTTLPFLTVTDGPVGIGTTSPTVPLDVVSAAAQVLRAGPGSALGAPAGTITLADTGVVGVLNGVYQYRYGESATGGLSAASAIATITVTNKQVRVTMPLPRRGTSQRYLYRTAAGSNDFKLVKAFNGGSEYFQTIWVDNVADGALGTALPAADTSLLYNLEVNDTVKFFRTHPSKGSDPADLTLLTADPSTPGSFALDAYGEIVARVQGTQTALWLSSTNPSATGNLILGQTLPATADGSSPTSVFAVSALGNTAITPGTLGDQGAGDGTGYILYGQATFAAVNTAGGQAYLLQATGAGSSSQIQRSVKASLAAGYTGTSDTYAFEALNQTASGGLSVGAYANAAGESAANVGVVGKAQSGTRNIGVFAGTGGAVPPTDQSAVIFGDNGSVNSTLLQLRTNGVDKYTITGAGVVTNYAVSGQNALILAPTDARTTAQNNSLVYYPVYNDAGSHTSVAAIKFSRPSTSQNNTDGQIELQTRVTGGSLKTNATLDKDGVLTVVGNVVAPLFKTTTALIAMGGATPAAFANGVGGAGQPTTAAQNGWLQMQDSTGATVWVPVWK